jgi:hypothetical protein
MPEHHNQGKVVANRGMNLVPMNAVSPVRLLWRDVGREPKMFLDAEDHKLHERSFRQNLKPKHCATPLNLPVPFRNEDNLIFKRPVPARVTAGSSREKFQDGSVSSRFGDIGWRFSHVVLELVRCSVTDQELDNIRMVLIDRLV